MTKKHFVSAAISIQNILSGNWTNEPPAWADNRFSGHGTHYDRAVQTAEAFIVLALEFNSRFDTRRFLVACGLVDAPVKASKRKAR